MLFFYFVASDMQINEGQNSRHLGIASVSFSQVRFNSSMMWSNCNQTIGQIKKGHNMSLCHFCDLLPVIIIWSDIPTVPLNFMRGFSRQKALKQWKLQKSCNFGTLMKRQLFIFLNVEASTWQRRKWFSETKISIFTDKTFIPIASFNLVDHCSKYFTDVV